jgi:hypothetical protein
VQQFCLSLKSTYIHRNLSSKLKYLSCVLQEIKDRTIEHSGTFPAREQMLKHSSTAVWNPPIYFQSAVNSIILTNGFHVNYCSFLSSPQPLRCWGWKPGLHACSASLMLLASPPSPSNSVLTGSLGSYPHEVGPIFLKCKSNPATRMLKTLQWLPNLQKKVQYL